MAGILGGFFTQGWVRGLRLEALPLGTPDVGKYADELGSAGESTNRYISLQEAMEFGKQVHDYDYGYSGIATPGYLGAGGPQYLGLPEFLIRDGSPSFYESPDVYLTHPNHGYLPPGDLYILDPDPPVAPYNNTINVDVRNIGTHPVRAYSLGIERFGSGLGAVEKQHTVCDQAPSGGVLFPMDAANIGTADDKQDTYAWNTPFPVATTHICVIAEAKLLCGDVDFSWNPSVHDYEAQRNIDEMTIVPSPPSPAPLTNLQGFKEHVYGIRNVFDDPRRFYMLFPPKFPDYKDIIGLQWFEIPQGAASERIPLKIVEAPLPHIRFDLKGGETRDLLVRVDMKPDFPADTELNLPFDLVVEGAWSDRPKVRETTHTVPMQDIAPIAGFTLVLRRGESTVKGIVLDQENKPVSKARVVLRTVNDLQGTVVKTDAAGNYELAGINPDVFRLRAETAGWRSKEQTVVLLAGKTEELTLELTEAIPAIGKPVKVILDKIRILNDHDPLIFGKGELTFTAIVVPDHDDSRK